MSVVPAPVSRLSPCPCGSGKRYKDCHGALPGAATSSRRSGYRPSGPEWNGLPEGDQDRLGALMEAALVHQRAGKSAEAARLYREVLAVAPKTHDALHMLGMARWSEGDYAEARKLIEEALSLQAEYPAIRQNLSLVLSAQRARETNAQEALCERALPGLFHLLRSPEGRTVNATAQEAPVSDNPIVHLIGAEDTSESDDAWLLRRLAVLLAAANPRVWVSRRQGNETAPAGRDAPYPRGGIQLWVGVDQEIAGLQGPVSPLRTLVFAQAASPSRWLDGLRAIANDGARSLELVVSSRAKDERFGHEHQVLTIPLDLAEFRGPRAQRHSIDEFVVGNVVQDGRTVAHARSGSLQERVAAAGYRVDVYDPGRARHALGAMRNVNCVSRRQATLAQFLAPLSCYLYVGDTWWKEGLGRDLFGAMALGIPVLCPRGSIHAEYVRDGVDGILYDDAGGALAALAALRADPTRRRAIGDAAGARARELFDPAALTRAYRRLLENA